jgi:uncharacterized cupredoxin-like copper-binding protein
MRSRYLIVGLLMAVLLSAFSLNLPAQPSDSQGVHICIFDHTFRTPGGQPGEPITIQAGKPCLITVENYDGIEHEVRLGRNPTSRFDGYQEPLLEGFLGLRLTPGQFATLLLEIPVEKRGEWEIGSFIGGDYQAGLKVRLIVE